jgi:hypothetical protein
MSIFVTTEYDEKIEQLEIEIEQLRSERNFLRDALLTVMGDSEHGQLLNWKDRCKAARAAIAATDH